MILYLKEKFIAKPRFNLLFLLWERDLKIQLNQRLDTNSNVVLFRKNTDFRLNSPTRLNFLEFKKKRPFVNFATLWDLKKRF